MLFNKKKYYYNIMLFRIHKYLVVKLLKVADQTNKNSKQHPLY